MITVERSKTGLPILAQDGRLLSSAYDPVKEAKAWAVQAQLRLQKHAAAVILGLGSGYHVAELLKLEKHKPIIVIEKSSEIARCVRDVSSEFIFESLIVDEDWTRLLDHDELKRIQRLPFCMLKHGPTCQQSAEYYTKVEKLLLARDKISFLIHLRQRPELFSTLDVVRLDRLEPEIISIKTLTKLFKNDQFMEERRLWKVLEELVL